MRRGHQGGVSDMSGDLQVYTDGAEERNYAIAAEYAGESCNPCLAHGNLVLWEPARSRIAMDLANA